MNLYLNKVLAELPEGLPEKIPIKFYSSDKIIVLSAENVFSEQRAFDSYKFLIPYVNSHPAIKLNKKKFMIEKNMFFSINPGQEHGFEINSKVPDFNAIFIDKNYLKQLSKELFGIGDINFNNINNKISPSLYQLFNKFIFEYTNKQAGYEFVLQGLNIQIIVNLLREMNNSINNKDLEIKSYNDKTVIKNVLSYFHANYKENFTLDKLAEEVNYSSFHLIRIFKKETGKTPFEYLQEIKIIKAKELLQNTNKSITDICFESGFNNRSYFSSIFKKKVGVAPSKFRKIILG
ncbi:MAG: helix-turn-helix domain-containing protein [Halanaerobiales bacterium]